MKVTTLLSALIALVCSPLWAASQPQNIKVIRQHYSTINRNLRHYRRVELELMNYSAEGGVLTAHFADARPRKIVVQLYGCQHQIQTEYYFWNNRLVFVDEVTLRYESLASSKVASRKEDRFYFVQGQLVRGLDRHKRQIRDATELHQQERQLLQRANQWLTMAQTASAGKRKAT